MENEISMLKETFNAQITELKKWIEHIELINTQRSAQKDKDELEPTKSTIG